MPPSSAAHGAPFGLMRARPTLTGVLLFVGVLLGLLASPWHAASAVWAEVTAPRTVGALAPQLGQATGNDLRSRLGSLLAAPESAWQHLTRDERAILLDGAATWIPYPAVASDDPDLAAAFDLVALAALDLAPETALDQLAVNAVLLELSPPVLADALFAVEPVPAILDDDTIFVVDHVIVAALRDATAAGVPVATLDSRGLLTVAVTPPGPTPRVAAPEPAPPLAPMRRAANGRSIPVIPVRALPPEALDTLALIARGGPFPFAQDGATFGNFEGNLPAAPPGFYREYTVITPGEDDRGARRIVTGDEDRIIYYTADHYDSFAEVMLND